MALVRLQPVVATWYSAAGGLVATTPSSGARRPMARAAWPLRLDRLVAFHRDRPDSRASSAEYGDPVALRDRRRPQRARSRSWLDNRHPVRSRHRTTPRHHRRSGHAELGARARHHCLAVRFRSRHGDHRKPVGHLAYRLGYEPGISLETV